MAESLKKVTERNDDLQEQLLMAQQNEDVITGERDSSDLHLKLDEAEARALKAEEDLNDITEKLFKAEEGLSESVDELLQLRQENVVASKDVEKSKSRIQDLEIKLGEAKSRAIKSET